MHHEYDRYNLVILDGICQDQIILKAPYLQNCRNRDAAQLKGEIK